MSVALSKKEQREAEEVFSSALKVMNNIDINIGKIFFKKYKIEKKIADGSFGTVYKGINIQNNSLVAIKLEDKKQSNFLEDEAYNLLTLKNYGIVEIISFGRTNDYNIMIQPLLGDSLYKLFLQRKKKFLLKDICLIGIQCIERLEWIHSKDIIHRDIKPENFVTGREDPSMLFAIDFGLSKKYRSSRTYKHIQYNNLTKGFIGTARYASVNALGGIELSRRDDLESFFYMIIYFILKNLPWQGVRAESIQKRNQKVYLMKKNFDIDSDTYKKKIPEEIRESFKYVKKLKFVESPNYQKIKDCFRRVLEKLGGDEGDVFSWVDSPKEGGRGEDFRNVKKSKRSTKFVGGGKRCSDIRERILENIREKKNNIIKKINSITEKVNNDTICAVNTINNCINNSKFLSTLKNRNAAFIQGLNNFNETNESQNMNPYKEIENSKEIEKEYSLITSRTQSETINKSILTNYNNDNNNEKETNDHNHFCNFEESTKNTITIINNIRSNIRTNFKNYFNNLKNDKLKLINGYLDIDENDKNFREKLLLTENNEKTNNLINFNNNINDNSFDLNKINTINVKNEKEDKNVSQNLLMKSKFIKNISLLRNITRNKYLRLRSDSFNLKEGKGRLFTTIQHIKNNFVQLELDIHKKIYEKKRSLDKTNSYKYVHLRNIFNHNLYFNNIKKIIDNEIDEDFCLSPKIKNRLNKIENTIKNFRTISLNKKEYY